ncbi:SRPBCC family protein [Paenibacillus koleovorans]|uniref:SRPBCC family protein n=1 Tax=Paenibacillus koleovorans TaxID=121608 RepID=UPI000FDAB925|nr:SRPBCC family protein [Paenibacillus koleovorans]
MLATIQKTEQGYTAHYVRHYSHSADLVWAYLTDNGYLQQWFSELRVDELRVGGLLKFDMQDGTFEEMEILDLEPKSVLEYTWGEDRVRFELKPEGAAGCRLDFIERIGKLTDHTPRDLAGWHVCLDVIAALLDGRTLERELEWKGWYEQYKARLAGLE